MSRPLPPINLAPTTHPGSNLPVLANQSGLPAVPQRAVLDRVASHPDYFKHLVKDLPVTNPARQAGSLTQASDQVERLRQTVLTAQKIGKLKLGAAAGFGIGGLSLMGAGLLTGSVLSLPLLGLSGLGIGMGGLKALRLRWHHKTQAELTAKLAVLQQAAARREALEKLSSELGLDLNAFNGEITEPGHPGVLAALSRPLADISHLPAWLQELLVPIAAGEFSMGSTTGHEDEKPVHRVLLSAFHMMRVPVYNDMCLKVMGEAAPSKKGFDGARQPVVHINHGESVLFAQRMTEKYGAGKIKFRLPTEAEYEYASRAGDHEHGTKSGELKTTEANYKATGVGKTTDVGSYAANAWGLQDMCGNVWEWCQDWYGTYASGLLINPMGANTGEYRVLRGGSWYSNFTKDLRSAFRNFDQPDERNCNLGLRLVVESVVSPEDF